MLLLIKLGRSQWLRLISRLCLVGIVGIDYCPVLLVEFFSLLVNEELTIGLSLAKVQDFRFSTRVGLTVYFLPPCYI